MHSGGVTRDVATWRMVIGGICCATLGFPVVFQFLGLKSFTFPNSSIISVTELFAFFFSVYLCYYFNFAPVAVLCVSSVCAEHFEGTFSFASIHFFFFIIVCKFLIFLFLFLCFVLFVACFVGFQDLNPSPPFFFGFSWLVVRG